MAPPTPAAYAEAVRRLIDGAGSSGIRQGALDDGLREVFGSDATPELTMEALNRLLRESALILGKLSDGTPVYRPQDNAHEAARLRGLNPDERLVLQLIESSGNTGMWTRDIRIRSNLQQVQVPKILKTLETRKLIKAVKSVASKNKKMYMRYDLEPPHEPFYNEEQELDHEFIDALLTKCHDHVRRQPEPCSLDAVHRCVRESNLSKVELRSEDVRALLDVLVHDGRLERSPPLPGPLPTPSPAGAGTGGGPPGKASTAATTLAATAPPAQPVTYRATRASGSSFVLVQMPCAACTLTASCQEGNEISPSRCDYYAEWLEAIDW
mmetsp:Transcript_25689/g.66426  ORF Transcript_25689/g.66426 Transcript_25689/m.66426 type:complete len:325 (+) Transcript_25689:165-1139(+)